MHQNGLEILKNISKQKNFQKIFYTRAVSDQKKCHLLALRTCLGFSLMRHYYPKINSKSNTAIKKQALVFFLLLKAFMFDEDITFVNNKQTFESRQNDFNFVYGFTFETSFGTDSNLTPKEMPNHPCKLAKN